MLTFGRGRRAVRLCVTCITWVAALVRRRGGRLAAAATGVALAVGLLASLGTFLSASKATMTRRAVDTVAVDWQIETQAGADAATVADRSRQSPGLVASEPVLFATTSGFESARDASTRTTGTGQVVGIDDTYRTTFPAGFRDLAGAGRGVLLYQQTAANLGARPGDTITYSGAASDPDEALTGNAMSWQVLLHHDEHVHPFQAVNGLGGSFVIEEHGAGTYYYEIILTVTDSRGATDRKAVNINIAPNTTTPTTTYLSDLNWTSATNGWGSVEKDRSNGEQGATDGNPLTLNGVKYTKGLGVHAGSDVRYNLNGAYKTFLADVGVDDEVGGNGSVIFQVYADGALLYDSGTLLMISSSTVTTTPNASVIHVSRPTPSQAGLRIQLIA